MNSRRHTPCSSETVTAGELPAHVRARASYGPETCAQAANLAVGHHIPIYRATLLLCQLAGIAVSTGRGLDRVDGRDPREGRRAGRGERVHSPGAELLKAAAVVHADETPARAADGTRYVHVALPADRHREDARRLARFASAPSRT